VVIFFAFQILKKITKIYIFLVDFCGVDMVF